MLNFCLILQNRESSLLILKKNQKFGLVITITRIWLKESSACLDSFKDIFVYGKSL